MWESILQHKWLVSEKSIFQYRSTHPYPQATLIKSNCFGQRHSHQWPGGHLVGLWQWSSFHKGANTQSQMEIQKCLQCFFFSHGKLDCRVHQKLVAILWEITNFVSSAPTLNAGLGKKTLLLLLLCMINLIMVIWTVVLKHSNLQSLIWASISASTHMSHKGVSEADIGPKRWTFWMKTVRLFIAKMTTRCRIFSVHAPSECECVLRLPCIVPFPWQWSVFRSSV